MRETEPFSHIIQIIGNISYQLLLYFCTSFHRQRRCLLLFIYLVSSFSFQAANAKGMNININTKINALDTYVTCQLASSIAPRN